MIDDGGGNIDLAPLAQLWGAWTVAWTRPFVADWGSSCGTVSSVRRPGRRGANGPATTAPRCGVLRDRLVSDDARAVLVGGVVAELSVAETAPMRHRARTVP